MVGMVLRDGRTVAGAGLSVTSLTNLSGIVAGLSFLSSWTSSKWPALIGAIETGDFEAEFGNMSDF